MQTAQDINRLYGSQAAYDNAQPAEDRRADAIEIACTQFAEEFCENQMDAETLFELAEAFGSEVLGDYLAEDDQHNLLQLVLRHSKDPAAKEVINRLYTAAYNHKEGELK
tara:strand:+ start:14010 stop:14339 length:330 start_codon:yes stop_codon:yes gene_type:complete